MKIAKAALASLVLSSTLASSAYAATAFIPSAAVTRPEGGLQRASLPENLDPFRRNVLQLGGSLPFFLFNSDKANAASQDSDGAASPKPLADLPMIRLRLPKSAFGREYAVIQLKLQGKGPFDFMIDSGLTTEMISPHLQSILGIKTGKSVIRGLSAGGDSAEALVNLSGGTLCCGEFADKNAKEMILPSLRAVVTDFPQEHIDPSHDVEGMLGMEFLDLFDADFDFPAGRLRLWAPGTARKEAERLGLIEIPDAVLNETGLLGIRVRSTEPGASNQPLIGILDCGASFSACNWAATNFLGLPPRDDQGAYMDSPSIVGVGVDGRPLPLPTRNTQFTFAGDASKDKSGKVLFTPPPKNWKPWKPVTIGIGDLPVFSELLGDGVTPYNGPAVLIGLDILSQRRIILETGKGRNRRLYVSPS